MSRRRHLSGGKKKVTNLAKVKKPSQGLSCIYFPIQKRLKIVSNSVSLTDSPVISPSA
jgi:hypothetical protein